MVASELPVLRLVVLHDPPRESDDSRARYWRLKWFGLPSGDWNYTVDAGAVEDLGDSVLAALQTLADDESLESQPRLGECLWQVVAAGRHLLDALTTPARESDAGDVEAADQVRRYLDSSAAAIGGARTMIIVTPTVPNRIPWGLVWAGPEPKSDWNRIALLDAEQCHQFWCMIYDVAVVPDVEIHYGTFARDSQIVVGISEDTHTNSTVQADLRVRFPQMKSSLSEWAAAAHSAQESNQLLYLFGHACGDRIHIGPAPPPGQLRRAHFQLTHNKLRHWTRTHNVGGTRGFIFLNGCHTADESDVHSVGRETWVSAAHCGQLVGMVGSIGRVPTDLAWTFGAALIDELMVSRKSLTDSLRSVRLRFWPHGLFYQAMCRGDQIAFSGENGVTTPTMEGAEDRGETSRAGS